LGLLLLGAVPYGEREDALGLPLEPAASDGYTAPCRCVLLASVGRMQMVPEYPCAGRVCGARIKPAPATPSHAD
jgi:hypothetical protein